MNPIRIEKTSNTYSLQLLAVIISIGKIAKKVKFSYNKWMCYASS